MTTTKPDKATAPRISDVALDPRLVVRARQRRDQFDTVEEWMEFRAQNIDQDPHEVESNTSSSWGQEIPLAAALVGGAPQEPTVCSWKDDDGAACALFYPNEVHSVFGEPESLKSWLLFFAAHQLISAEQHVLCFDMESNQHAVVARLMSLGAAPQAIARFFHYYRPDGPITEDAVERWRKLVHRVQPALVILDGVTEAFATQAKDINSQVDTANWYRSFARRFLVDPEAAGYAGPAVVEIDHVVKSKDERGRWAIGSQHKMAGLKGAAYLVENVSPLSKGKHGSSRILCEKDSPGGVRWVRNRKHQRLVGLLQIDATGSNGLDAYIESPSADRAEEEQSKLPLAETSEFRALMHETWKFIVNTPSCSQRLVRTAVTASNDKVAQALEVLERDGYIRNEATGTKQKWAAVPGKEFEPLRVMPRKAQEHRDE